MQDTFNPEIKKAIEERSSRDITGKKFFLLTAVERLKPNHYGWVWLCKCACGNPRKVLYNHLTSGVVKSCGPDCPKSQAIKDRIEKAEKKSKNANKEYVSYTVKKYEAKTNGLKFSLTFEQFKEIRNGRCSYGNGERPEFFIGIDRKDPLAGYVVGNAVPCCTKHNVIKGIYFSYEEMLEVVANYPGTSECGNVFDKYGNKGGSKKLETVSVESPGLEIALGNRLIRE